VGCARAKPTSLARDALGMVSKRVDRPYRAGRSKDLVKVRKRNHPAMDRVMDPF
jgi:ATP-dependent DNA ligase